MTGNGRVGVLTDLPGQKAVYVFEELTLGTGRIPHDAHVEIASERNAWWVQEDYVIGCMLD